MTYKVANFCRRCLMDTKRYHHEIIDSIRFSSWQFNLQQKQKNLKQRAMSHMYLKLSTRYDSKVKKTIF